MASAGPTGPGIVSRQARWPANFIVAEHLRELVARLSEAELFLQGLSPAAVTWGANQTAADGGLNVRMEFSGDVTIAVLIPRPLTGFQVKAREMPRATVLPEMSPGGSTRLLIQ